MRIIPPFLFCVENFRDFIYFCSLQFLAMSINKLFGRFNQWRLRNLNPRYLNLLLSIVVGILSGLAAVTIKNSVHIIQEFLTHGFAKDYHSYYFFIYPFIGLSLTYLFIKYIGRRGDVIRGIPGVLWAIKKKNSLIRLSNTITTMIASILTVGFGGSVGLEGPTVSTNSAMASYLGRKLGLDYKTVTLLIGCAATGSMAGIFNAPIAALVFVLEVFMFDLTTTSMIPFLAASISGAVTSRFMLGDNVLFSVTLTEKFLLADIPFHILLGMITGLISVYFNRVIYYFDLFFKRYPKRIHRLLIASFALGVLIFLIPPLYGEGFAVINSLLKGVIEPIFQNSFIYEYRTNTLVLIVLLLFMVFFKAIATTLTMNAGGVQGVFAPSLFLGATTGFIFSKAINYFNIAVLSEKNFTLVGMAGLIAGVLHAPLTSLFLIAEITKGYDLIIPLMIIASISYLTTKYFVKESIFAMKLAQRGEILTHHKDKNVLTMMNLKDEIETDFFTVDPDGNLGDLIKVVAKSHRNIYPVVTTDGFFVGVITLDEVREIMFKTELYDKIKVEDLMFYPKESVAPNENLESVMEKFNETNYWNLPVLENGQYIGFISKSKLFNAYREKLLYFSEE